MKLLRKINRGFILSVLVLIAVAVYLIALSISHNAAKPKIREICTNYIQTEIRYKMLPEKYRKESPEIPKDELSRYIDDMTRDIKAFYDDNELSYKHLIEKNKANLESQSNGIHVVFDYQKEIIDFKDFVFDGNTVTVTILTNSSYDGPNAAVAGMRREKIFAQTTDTITLKKQGNEWKLVYADLQQPTNNINNMGAIYKTSLQ